MTVTIYIQPLYLGQSSVPKIGDGSMEDGRSYILKRQAHTISHENSPAAQRLSRVRTA